MKKIVYFDEQSAGDYIDISLGGHKTLTSQEIIQKQKNLDASIRANLKAKFNWLPFIGVSSEIESGGKYNFINDKLINATISNTILTDFIEKTKSDDSIIKFQDCTLSAYPNSLTYYKLFTPYVIISKNNDENIDVAKLDEALEKGKGYYELIAKTNNIQQILRFNIKAFRNNYNLSDLLKMNLKYITILVGTYNAENLNMNNEFQINNQDFQIIQLEETNPNLNDLNVYDVILAGVI